MLLLFVLFGILIVIIIHNMPFVIVVVICDIIKCWTLIRSRQPVELFVLILGRRVAHTQYIDSHSTASAMYLTSCKVSVLSHCLQISSNNGLHPSENFSTFTLFLIVITTIVAILSMLLLLSLLSDYTGYAH